MQGWGFERIEITRMIACRQTFHEPMLTLLPSQTEGLCHTSPGQRPGIIARASYSRLKACFMFRAAQSMVLKPVQGSNACAKVKKTLHEPFFVLLLFLVLVLDPVQCPNACSQNFEALQEP